jgi:hypothetical protein
MQLNVNPAWPMIRMTVREKINCGNFPSSLTIIRYYKKKSLTKLAWEHPQNILFFLKLVTISRKQCRKRKL